MFNRFSSALGKRYTKQLTNTINTLSARYKSTISLANLKDNDGARYFPKQLGRGRSSGKGKTSTRGQKGYYARSGASGLIWYEGGQSPLWLRTPKYGMEPKKDRMTVTNLGRVVNAVAEGKIDPTKTITLKEMREAGIIKRKSPHGVKLLAYGNSHVKRLPVPLNIEVTHSSRIARDVLRENGGDVKFVWHSRLALKHMFRPKPNAFVPGPSVPPPKLTLRYEHQLCGPDDVARHQELRLARIQRRVRKRN